MAVYSAVPFLPMSVIIIASGFLSDWLVRMGVEEKRVRRTLIIVGLAIGCLIVPAGLVADKITAVWLLTISLCGLGICSPNTWTLTQAVCDKKIVGTVSGIQNFGGNVGGILAPAVTGFIAHATDSFALAFGLCGVIMLVGMYAYWFLISDEVQVAEEN
jgi:MFS family permease